MRFNNETELKEYFVQVIKKDFVIYSEVTGKHIDTGIFHGKIVRIDFLLKPKKHLLKCGFISGFIGVEVKHFTGKDGLFRKKACRVFTQAKRYFKSVFILNGETVKPSAVFVFTNLSDQEILSKGDRQSVWEGMATLASRDGVGECFVGGVFPLNWWKLCFCGDGYFSYYSDKYKLHNPHTLGEKGW